MGQKKSTGARPPSLGYQVCDELACHHVGHLGICYSRTSRAIDSQKDDSQQTGYSTHARMPIKNGKEA
jgi:hypothetical protein